MKAFTAHDRAVLRHLARSVNEIAALPSEAVKRELWKQHTTLAGTLPPIFVSPEGSWREILPETALECEADIPRKYERELKQRLFRYNSIKDDTPVERQIDIPVSDIPITADWGLQPCIRPAVGQGGSWHHVSVIEQPSDWKRLKRPHLRIYRDSAAAVAEELGDAIGDLIDVRLTGLKVFDFHITHVYCDFRGLENFLYDLSDEPEMVEDVFSFFEEGMAGLLDEAEQYGLVQANNDYTYHYTGGLGYCAALKSTASRLSEVWGAAEAQEYAVVSPEMFARTILPHEKRLLERFALSGYGCCDDLTHKLDSVLEIKNLRRVAACPWADLKIMAGRLKKNYILTWKPNPAYLAMDVFDEAGLKNYLVRSLTAAQAGYPEIILRDTHTCRNHPERFGAFVRICREAIAEVSNLSKI